MKMKTLTMYNLFVSLIAWIFVSFVCVPVSTAESQPGTPTAGGSSNAPAVSGEHVCPWDNDYFYEYDWWDPSEVRTRLQQQMDRLFESTFGHNFSRSSSNTAASEESFFIPDVDVSETEEAYLIRLDLPGMDKDRIEVNVVDNILTIKGERQAQKEDKEEGEEGIYYYRKERSFGAFERSIPLPTNVSADEINAQYENGVLTVTLPKNEPTSVHQKEGKKIQIM